MIKSHAYYRHQFWINLVMILVTISMIMPLVLLLMSSLTSEEALIRNGYSFIPETFSLDAYRYIMLNRSTVFRAYAITIILTILGTVLSVVLSSTAAYALADRKLPFRGAISFFFVFTMLFNGGLVPTYINYTTVFHIKDTIFGLLVPSLMMNAFNVAGSDMSSSVACTGSLSSVMPSTSSSTSFPAFGSSALFIFASVPLASQT